MPVDPTGTTPGLQTQPAEKPAEIFLKCKREGCDSITAIELKIPGLRSHTYRCTKCGETWSITIGGAFEI